MIITPDIEIKENADEYKDTLKTIDKDNFEKGTLVNESKQTSDLRFEKESNLIQQSKLDYNSKLIKCPKCIVTFKHKTSLTRHLKTIHKEKKSSDFDALKNLNTSHPGDIFSEKIKDFSLNSHQKL